MQAQGACRRNRDVTQGAVGGPQVLPQALPLADAVLQHSGRSNSAWRTSTRAKLASRRSARIGRRGNVSKRFSARTACE